MKKIALMALATLAMGSVQAQAADYGIGVSVQSNDSTIYAPVDLSDKLRIEPSLRYRKDKLHIDGVDTNSTTTDTDTKTLDLGIGLFGLSAVNKSVRIYYGGRVSYVDQRTTQTVQFLFGSDRVTTKSDGFRIAPTIGFEYLVNERLSLGGEAAYFYQKTTGDFDTKSNGTDTRLILRFKF